MTNKSNKKKSISLISCKTCNKEISTMTDSCPGCGAPNDWLHPEIENFLSLESIETAKPFNFEYDRTQIWGETETSWPWWIWMIFLFLAIVGMAPITTMFGWLPGLVGIITIYYLVGLVYRGKKKEFQADLNEGVWESSDDDFWQPVRSVLNL